MIRDARLEDIDALVALEERCFETDRLSRRNFRHLIAKGKAVTLLEESQGQVTGYVLVLFHRGTSLARLYSIAVDPALHRSGLGRRLTDAAENAARARDCVTMRLEIRTDNHASIGLFKEMGYREFGTYTDYYEDHMSALRMEKRLVANLEQSLAHVPYYQQTLEFTCGPATLMMAMKAVDDSLMLGRRLELRLWREATTIFMTAGHGGCGPYGMALSAYQRGFPLEVFVNDLGTMFVDSVRSEEKKEVMRLVEEDFLAEIEQAQIPLHYRPIRVPEMISKMACGGIPVILISSYRIYKEKFPHWVVVTGYDDRFIYVHDSFVDIDKGKSVTDCINMPILKREFEQMARYGKSGQRAALIIYPKGQQAVATPHGEPI